MFWPRPGENSKLAQQHKVLERVLSEGNPSRVLNLRVTCLSLITVASFGDFVTVFYFFAEKQNLPGGSIFEAF